MKYRQKQTRSILFPGPKLSVEEQDEIIAAIKAEMKRKQNELLTIRLNAAIKTNRAAQ